MQEGVGTAGDWISTQCGHHSLPVHGATCDVRILDVGGSYIS